MRSATELFKSTFSQVNLKLDSFLFLLVILIFLQIFSFGLLYVREIISLPTELNVIFSIFTSVFQFSIYLLVNLATLHILASQKDSTIREVVQFAQQNFGKGVKVALLVFFYTYLGFVIAFGVSFLIFLFDPLLGVPLLVLAFCFSIYLVIRFFYALNIAVLENKNTKDAIEYAKFYTEGKTFPVVWRLFCVSLITVPILTTSVYFIYNGFSFGYVTMLSSFVLIPFGLFVSVYNFEIYKDLRIMYRDSNPQLEE